MLSNRRNAVSALSGGDCGELKIFRTNLMGGKPRGATPHQFTPDAWAQIGGKWVLFLDGGRETVSPIGVYFRGLHLYGDIFIEFTTIWVYFQRAFTHRESLETRSRELPVASALKPLTYGYLLQQSCYNTIMGLSYCF